MIRHSLLPSSLLLAILLLTGCSQTRTLGAPDRPDLSFDQVQQTLEGRTVDLRLSDQRSITSTALLIRQDTVWTIDQLTGQVRMAPAREIASIGVNRPGRAVAHGAVLGAAAGSLLGLATGFGLTSIRDEDQATTSLAYFVAVPTAFFAVLGIGTGSVLGARRGSVDRYVYPSYRLAEEPVSPAGPLPARSEIATRRN